MQKKNLASNNTVLIKMDAKQILNLQSHIDGWQMVALLVSGSQSQHEDGHRSPRTQGNKAQLYITMTI